MKYSAGDWIDKLGLEPHPEGGWFKETFRSPHKVKSWAHGRERNALTDILFLLRDQDVSRWHRVEHDEIWHFHFGEEILILDFDPETGKLQEIQLGPKAARFQHCVLAGHWQAAQPLGSYSLMGCSVAPGFDFKDFAFAVNGSKTFERLQKFKKFSHLL